MVGQWIWQWRGAALTVDGVDARLRAVVLVCIAGLASGCTSVGYQIGLADCAPVYGNWCGENYPTTGNDPYAVDDWDEACRSHDLCYDDGEPKERCDREFIAELRELSYEQLAPQRMHNAYSVFSRDGYVGGWVQFRDEAWSFFASCEGGDGVAAEFRCALNQFQGCPLYPESGPGRAGMPCTCGGYPGRIVEI